MRKFFILVVLTTGGTIILIINSSFNHHHFKDDLVESHQPISPSNGVYVYGYINPNSNWPPTASAFASVGDYCRLVTQ